MSQYSEIIGSFKRLGNYPIESDYIFPTVEELKQFYNDPINATTLHQGLLKVVENGGDGKQALYWVVQNEGKLEFVKLLQDSSIDTLDELIEKVNQEIQDRQNWNQIIIGTSDYDVIPSDLNSLYDLANEVEDIKDLHAKNESDLKAIVGTDQDDIVYYLKILPYSSLTEMANALQDLILGVTIEANNSGTVNFAISQVQNGYAIKGNVNIAEDSTNILEESGNALIVKGTSEKITHNGQALNTVLQNKADLVEGKVPKEQLPDVSALISWSTIE